MKKYLPKTKGPNSNEITKKIMNWLKCSGFFAWRNNQIPAPGRAFVGLKGVPDILGFHKATGMGLYIEVKSGDDTLRPEQKEFLLTALAAGTIAFVAWDYETAVDKIMLFGTDREQFRRKALVKNLDVPVQPAIFDNDTNNLKK